MNDARKSTAPSEDIDEALAGNFRVRIGARSVQTLRREMADRGIAIGSGAIQAMKQGSRGVRLETLQKFADFFECTVSDLLRSPESEDVVWPFTRLDPASFALVGDDVRAAAEDMLISAAKRSPRASRGK
jgi:DNA-binding Xre family transcriptional regulator